MAERLPSKSKLRGRSQEERRRMSTASSRSDEIEESLQRIQKQGKYVKMNVGGVLYCTTLGTLTKHDNMLRAMFSERIPLQKDDEGESASNRIKWLVESKSFVFFSKDGLLSIVVANTLEVYSTLFVMILFLYPTTKLNVWKSLLRPSK